MNLQDHRVGSWRVKGTDKSFPRADSSVPLMRHDPSDLGSLIQIRIILKESTLSIYGLIALIFKFRKSDEWFNLDPRAFP